MTLLVFGSGRVRNPDGPHDRTIVVRNELNLGLLEQVVAQHIIEATPPGFVRVTSDVDALGKFHLFCLSVLHINIDVQYKVADLLHSAPSGPVGPGFESEVALASVAIADFRRAGNLSRSSTGMETILKRPDASSFC
jgi:hypothetical protein